MKKTDKKSDTGSNLKNMVESATNNIAVKDIASKLVTGQQGGEGISGSVQEMLSK